MTEPIKVLTANVDKPNSKSIETYIAGGGYEAARKALGMKKMRERLGAYA